MWDWTGAGPSQTGTQAQQRQTATGSIRRARCRLGRQVEASPW